MPSTESLAQIARLLMAPGKGLLAMDESTSTCNQRFADLGIPQTEAARRDWRDLIVSTLGLGDYISGAILFDETVHQQRLDGTSFIKVLTDAGIVPGIKLDQGAKPLPFFAGETVTEGLDGLRERIADYAKLGIRFAKWRAVINPGPGLPSAAALEANAHALARYAALCQEGGIVPVVEPEVLMSGTQSLAECQHATSAILQAVFEQLYKQGVQLEGVILKPNMVTPGLKSTEQASVPDVAAATVQTLLRHVPPAVAGVAFLSGGQSAELASARLNAMHQLDGRPLPWPLTFSYSRAVQHPALVAWSGNNANISVAQQALLRRARLNSLASQGQYQAAEEQ